MCMSQTVSFFQMKLVLFNFQPNLQLLQIEFVFWPLKLHCYKLITCKSDLPKFTQFNITMPNNSWCMLVFNVVNCKTSWHIVAKLSLWKATFVIVKLQFVLIKWLLLLFVEMHWMEYCTYVCYLLVQTGLSNDQVVSAWHVDTKLPLYSYPPTHTYVYVCR